MEYDHDFEFYKNLSDSELTALVSGTLDFDPEETRYLNEEEIRYMIPVAFFYALIFLLGIIGNSLVIYCVAKYKRMKSNTNQLLLSLACADLLVILVCVPIKFAKLFSYGWIFGEVMCKLTHYIQTWSMVTSVMTLTAISIERYYAISQPLRAKSICTTNHARAVILSIWISASGLSLPIVFVQKYHSKGIIDPIYSCDKSHMGNKRGDMIIIGYELYMLALLFVVPVIVMLCTYVGVCVELWAATDSITQSTSVQIADISKKSDKGSIVAVRANLQENTTTTELVQKSVNQVHNTREAQVRKQVMKMLFMVVVIFVLCWCPLLCYNLAVATGTIIPDLPDVYPYAPAMNKAFSLLSYANSCLNPIVYGFMSRYFRKSFKQALSSCCLLNERKYKSYHSKRHFPTDRSSSSLRKPGECVCGVEATKRNTITTLAADSTLSRSPPISPHNTYSTK